MMSSRREAPPSISALNHQWWRDQVARRREQFAERLLDDIAKAYGIPRRILRGRTRIEWGEP